MKKLNFIGIGGATNVELGGNSCYLKEDNNLLIIDVCEGATEKLKRLKVFDGVKNIYIVITHMHFDHLAGLGILIWHCNFNLNIKPRIIYSNFMYAHSLGKLLKLAGVKKKHVEFIKDLTFSFNDLTLKMKRTSHTPELQCFGIMFEDKLGKYYYTGDTNDIRYIRELCKDDTVKIIYSEVATETYGMHLKYDDIVKLDKEKLVLMHFDTIELYNKAKDEGFEVACIK